MNKTAQYRRLNLYKAVVKEDQGIAAFGGATQPSSAKFGATKIVATPDGLTQPGSQLSDLSEYLKKKSQPQIREATKNDSL